MSFFFTLDVVSTLSLVLDISWIADELFCASEDGDAGGNAIRASRASRAGTRAARVVRIIRLIRIVMLYKAIQEAEAKKRRLQKAKDAGHDDDWLMDEADG